MDEVYEVMKRHAAAVDAYLAACDARLANPIDRSLDAAYEAAKREVDAIEAELDPLLGVQYGSAHNQGNTPWEL